MSEETFLRIALVPDAGYYTELVAGLPPEAAGILLRSADTICTCGAWHAEMAACLACGVAMCRDCEAEGYPGLCCGCELVDEAISLWREVQHQPAPEVPPCR